MTTPEPLPPVIVDPADQHAVWFLGVLTKIRIGGAATGGALSVLEHREERGHATPLHRHDIADETFLMIDGTLRVEVDGETYTAGAGAMAFLPRNRSHRFIVTSPTAHFLTLHTPAGFEDFAVTAENPLCQGRIRRLPRRIPPNWPNWPRPTASRSSVRRCRSDAFGRFVR